MTSESFNVDKYRSVFESDEAWSLRKEFLETYKDTFDEDRLVCLAQAYCNVEMDGCRYPDQLMEQIACLAKDFKRLQQKKKKMKFVKEAEYDNKAVWNLKCTQNVNAVQLSMTPVTKNAAEGTAGLKDLVLICDAQGTDSYQGLISRVASFNHLQCTFLNTDLADGRHEVSVSLNKVLLAEACGETEKLARRSASKAAIVHLVRSFPTILECRNSSDRIALEEVIAVDEADRQFAKLSLHSSIGAQMMRNMGWNGGGLGLRSDGITEPVKESEWTNRTGFGSDISGMKVLSQFKGNVKKMLADYLHQDTYDDLVFSSELPQEVRKEMHLTCKIGKYRGCLKTTSRSKGKARYITVSKVIHPSFVQILKRNNNKLGKYKLCPKGTVDVNKFIRGPEQTQS